MRYVVQFYASGLVERFVSVRAKTPALAIEQASKTLSNASRYLATCYVDTDEVRTYRKMERMQQD